MRIIPRLKKVTVELVDSFVSIGVLLGLAVAAFGGGFFLSGIMPNPYGVLITFFVVLFLFNMNLLIAKLILCIPFPDNEPPNK